MIALINEEGTQFCALFGLGLIGNTVDSQLSSRGFKQDFSFHLSWDDAGSRIECLKQIESRLQWHPEVRFHLIWCAGTGNLGSTEQDLECEKIAFLGILDWLERLGTPEETTLHYVSSAGALFEGQKNVGPDCIPRPLSPYGQMKLEQERCITNSTNQNMIKAVIYRPSTVYGSHEYHRRAGLVSHIMWNALRNVPTCLEQNIHVLRDYVYCEDVGRDIAINIERARPDRSCIRHLVSAKPSSIHEVFLKVSQLFGHSLPYCFNAGSRNDEDITFSARIPPPEWTPTPMPLGLHKVLNATRKSYLLETFQ